MRKNTKCPLHITTHKEETKMECIHSLNTSCLCNERCKARMKNGNAICSECFAVAHLNHYPNCKPPFEKNGEILSRRILGLEELPKINDVIFRFESFGDLMNDIHFINYINICIVNPCTSFALWTKNIDIVYDVFYKMGYKKPDNLAIVYSSTLKNIKADIPHEVLGYIDHLFTVYDKKHIDGVSINCGKKHCIDCQLCYHKNDTFFINELLKKDQKAENKKKGGQKK